jgi:hypothetical protein
MRRDPPDIWSERMHEIIVRIDEKHLQHLEDEMAANLSKMPREYTPSLLFLLDFCESIREHQPTMDRVWTEASQRFLGEPSGNTVLYSPGRRRK